MATLSVAVMPLLGAKDTVLLRDAPPTTPAKKTAMEEAARASHGEQYKVTNQNLILKSRIGAEPGDAIEGMNRPLGIPVAGLEQNDKWRRQARLFISQQDYPGAENLYLKILDANISTPERLDVLLELASLYELMNQRAKTVAVLENFVALSKNDPRKGPVYLELGGLYRSLGNFKRAQEAYHNVLNISLSGTADQMDLVQTASLQAKIEIAETYLMQGQLDAAERYLWRLQPLQLNNNDKRRVTFQAADLSYLRGNYQEAAVGFERFLKDYPDSTQSLEARFLLSASYRKLGKFDDALKEVLILLQDERIANSADLETLLYWRGRAGNQIANAFYEQGDYTKALTIYQAMAPLSDSPDWQWPVLYQIGLCFERLRMYPKAKEAYAVIVEGDDDKKQEQGPGKNPLTESQVAIYESAKWRLQQMEWSLNMDKELQSLNPPDVNLSPPV